MRRHSFDEVSRLDESLHHLAMYAVNEGKIIVPTSMKDVVKAAQETGLDNLKVMIGGAPLTQSYADEIGANGYAPDAASAVDKAKELLEIGN